MNKKLFIGGLSTFLFLLCGIIAFVVGAYATGWHVLEWFISPTAYLVYAIFVVLGIGFVALYIKKRNN